MFGHIARFAARPGVAGAAAAAAANAAQGSVQARAPPQGARTVAAHAPDHGNKIVDRDTESWVLAEMKDEVVLFQPFDGKEVEEAASAVMAMWGGRSSAANQSGPIVTEPDEDAGDGRSSTSGACSDCGDDVLANAVIEAAAAAGSDAVAQIRAKEREQLENLMAITKRMLRRPGLQREVVMCMLEDPDVRHLMLRQCDDLDRYLIAAGIHTPALLPPPGAVTIGGDHHEHGAAAGSGSASIAVPPRASGPSLVSRLVGAVAGVLERAGDALALLGDWLRRQLHAAFPMDDEAQVGEGNVVAAPAGAEGGGAARHQRKANQVLGTVMVLAVAVFCVAIIRRPLVLRALSRR